MRRGEVWIARLNPNRGKEVGKTRPVVIMQADELLALGNTPVIILPLTTRIFPSFQLWRITLPARDRLLEDCQVMVDHPRTLDRDRFTDGPLTTLTDEEMRTIEKSMAAVLGLYTSADRLGICPPPKLPPGVSRRA